MDKGGGSLVWVCRKNGRWWPGRIVAPNEIPIPLSSSKLPIMLLGRSSNSMDWYKMESKRLKPFRCGEFDDCIEAAASSGSSKYFNEGGVIGDTRKTACRQDAILHALAIENKENRNKLKRAGDTRAETICRPKRLKSTCVSLNSQSLMVEKSPVRSESSPIVIRLKTALTDHSSGNDHKNSAENSGYSQRQMRSMTVKKQGEGINWSKSLKCGTDASTNHNGKQKEHGDNLYRGDALKNQKKSTLQRDQQVMADQLPRNGTSRIVKQISEAKTAENTDINSIKQLMLVDVDVTVQKVSGGEQVPFICMIGRTSQKPIIGHPIDIEVLADSSKIFCGKTNGITKYSFGPAGDIVPKLGWRKAKRTPVCYSSISKAINTSLATQSSSYSKGKESGYRHAPEFVGKDSRKHPMSSDHTLLHAVKNRAKADANGRVDCVPVKHIVSRLLAAVG